MALPKDHQEVAALDCKGRGCKPLRAKRHLRERGKHCVFSSNGKLVRCFRDKRTAAKVAKGFGSGFRVKPRR